MPNFYRAYQDSREEDRALMRELTARGHRVTFLQRAIPLRASSRDLPPAPYGRTGIYRNSDELVTNFAPLIEEADVVMIGSYVPDGINIARKTLQMANGVTAFYDLDTPVTLAELEKGACQYLEKSLIPQFDLYLSFTGGLILRKLECHYGSPMARPLYCSFDSDQYFPESLPFLWDLGFMGTYSRDRQGPLEKLLFDSARRWPEGKMMVAGPPYPEHFCWPENLIYMDQIEPAARRQFYCSQRFTLNITQPDMIRAGHSPSVRLFEAAACGTPIITDSWPGLETFFAPGKEILIARDTNDVLAYLRDLPERERTALSENARKRVIHEHSSAARVWQLEHYFQLALEKHEKQLAG